MCKEINESNFKVLCLKDDNSDGRKFFYKDEILECKNGKLKWGGESNFISTNIYNSYNSFIKYWRNELDISSFKLIEVDGQPIIKEDNFKIKALKDEDVFFKKGDIFKFVDGVTTWRNGNKSKKYESFNDFLNRNAPWINNKYLNLIEENEDTIDLSETITDKDIENKIRNLNLSKECQDVQELLKEKNIQQNTNSKQFEKLWDSGIIGEGLITLNWGDEEQFFEAVKNNEPLVYIDENVTELNYEQLKEIGKYSQRVVSFVDNNTPIDITKEEIEKKLGYKINIVE